MRPRSDEEEQDILAFAMVVDRSRGMEKSGFWQGAPAPETGRLKRFQAQAEELAALSGRFDPVELAGLVAGSWNRTEVLNGLAPACSTHADGIKVWWMLEPRIRTTALGRLLQEHWLEERLAGALPSTDGFGKMLRRLLIEQVSLAPESIDLKDLPDLAAALEAAEGLDFPKPDREKVQQLLTKSRFLADYDVLLQQGFYGRKRQLQEFDEFLQGRRGDRLFHHTSAVILTGLGGAGKSTFLAKVARELVGSATATVVILDFDRPGINPSDEYWLEMEIARQVASQYPALDVVLRQRREDAREIHQEGVHTAQSFTVQAESMDRGTRELLISGIHEALDLVGATARPFLLVLDTFEEVVQRDLSLKIYKWLEKVSEAFYSGVLKVVISGRLFDRARDALKQFGIKSAIELSELEPDDVRALLRDRGVATAMADRLAYSRILPLHPLELKLLARLINAGEIQSVDEIESEIEKGGRATSELFAALVYRRVLLRVAEVTRSIAYPGLVLRYVTKELIRDILVPALKLPPMDDGKAQEALDALAGYDWLAYRQNGEVWHRKELRRSMLKAMVGNERELAERVHRAAITYFEREGSAKSLAEATYHRLMLQDSQASGESISRERLQQAYEYINADVADLPAAASALLRFAVGFVLTVDEMMLLPEPYLLQCYQSKGQGLISSREYRAARQMMQRVQARVPLGEPEPWETETLFATASWEDLRLRLGTARRSKGALEGLVNLLFPAAVVAPGTIEIHRLEELLLRARRQVQDLAPSAEWNTYFERMALSLPILHLRSPLPDSIVDAMAEILKTLKHWSSRDVSPLLGRRLLFLDLLRGSGLGELRVAMGPETIRLDKAWLSSFMDGGGIPFQKDSAEVMIREATEILTLLQRGARRQTVRGVLGAIASLPPAQMRRGGLALASEPDDRLAFFKLVCGPDPEFREPACFALDQAFPDEAGRRQLGAMFAKHIDLPLTDLTPEAFSKALPADPEHGMESYVELADRAGKLAGILAEAFAARQNVSILADVSKALDTWIESVRQLCLTTNSF